MNDNKNPAAMRDTVKHLVTLGHVGALKVLMEALHTDIQTNPLLNAALSRSTFWPKMKAMLDEGVPDEVIDLIMENANA